MLNTLKVAAATAFALLVLVFFAFFFNFLDLGLFKTFAPKFEQARYDTFENSQAARDSAIRDLNNFQSDYGKAQSDAQRQVIALAVVHQFEVYDRTKLPMDLQMFYNQMKAQQ